MVDRQIVAAFADGLRKARLSRNMNQGDMAFRAAGFSARTIGRYEDPDYQGHDQYAIMRLIDVLENKRDQDLTVEERAPLDAMVEALKAQDLADSTSTAGRALRSENRQQDSVLETYFDRMHDLLLHERLLESGEGDTIRDIAQSQTLTALRRLDGSRRRSVVEFLYNARLIGAWQVAPDYSDIDTAPRHPPIIELRGADLSHTDLSKLILNGANLFMANMSHADLSASWLNGCQLAGANLSDAVLSESQLAWTNLTGANLARADLSQAILVAARLTDASVTEEQLNTAESLAGATLPNGFALPDDFDGSLPHSPDGAQAP